MSQIKIITVPGCSEENKDWEDSEEAKDKWLHNSSLVNGIFFKSLKGVLVSLISK